MPRGLGLETGSEGLENRGNQSVARTLTLCAQPPLPVSGGKATA